MPSIPSLPAAPLATGFILVPSGFLARGIESSCLRVGFGFSLARLPMLSGVVGHMAGSGMNLARPLFVHRLND